MKKIFLKGLLLVAMGLLFLYTPLQSQSWKQYPYSPEGSVFTFPGDEGRHTNESIEWWYMAGHLSGNTTGTSYSFMLTYFHYPAYGFDGFRILNLCNENTGAYHSETLPLLYTSMDTLSLNIQAVLLNDTSESWTTKKDMDDKLLPFEYSISAGSENASLDLESSSLKPPLILGDSGLFYQGSQSYTYYYSLTENRIEGILSFEGVKEEVSGTAWIDRQYGSFNPITEEKYEWFYVQLSNGMDINIWNIFTPDNQLPDKEEYKHISVYVDSAVQYTTHDFELERLAYSYIPDDTVCYAQKWHLTSESNQIDLILTTHHHHTEVQLPFRFFEGSISVQGTVDGTPVDGIGFAELLKAYNAPDIVFTSPPGTFWSEKIPINWQLMNPDQGRSTLYDLEYSTDQGTIFSMVENGLKDSTFLWSNPPLDNGDSLWFKLTAYSVDSTLLSSIQSTVALIYKEAYTSIQDFKYESGNIALKLYPNPVKDKLYLESELDLTNQSYEIIDYTGRLISHGKLHSFTLSSEIDIHKLSKGIYFLRIRHKDGDVIQSFMVED